MQAKRIIILLALIFSTKILGAQIIRDENSSETVKVFDVKEEPASEPVFNAIKISPFHVLSGKYMLFYERRLREIFSVEGGLGFTYGDPWDIFYSDLDESYSVTNSFGSAVELSGRFFPQKEAFSGIYFGLNARAATFNKLQTPDFSSTPISLSSKQAGILVTAGYQTDSWMLDGVLVDYYVAFGVSNNSRQTIDEVAANGTVITTSGLAPSIKLGIKIGFGF